MHDDPRLNAVETIRGVLTDLAELPARVESLRGLEAPPAGALREIHATARILDRLSEELAEAAADVRRIR